MHQLATYNDDYPDEYDIRQQYEEKISFYENQVRSLAYQLSKAEEFERKSVMTELHDGTIQDLAGAQIKLGAIRKLASPYGLTGIIDEVREEIHQTIENIRSLIFENSPPLLDHRGLKPAIAWLVSNTAEKHGFRIDFQSDDCPQRLERHLQAFVYRTVRELLMNIVKHAKAAKVRISLREINRRMQIEILDDGVGFNAENLYSFAQKGHYGIYNIVDRIRHYNGQITIKSRPEKGTHISLSLPLF